MLAPALELDAAEVAAAPLLGYRIVEVAEPGDRSTTAAAPQLRVSQPWIETENSPVTIDVKLFWALRPLDSLLVTGSEASAFVPSLSDALADFGGRWAISSELHDRVASAPPIEALLVDGGDAEALVWRQGMVIGAHKPLATTLKLLIAAFSEAARRTYVYASPRSLESALSLLPDDVKSRYVPRAADFYEQALRELHEGRVHRRGVGVRSIA